MTNAAPPQDYPPARHVLRDLGIVNVDEPFTNLLCQGMVCHETYDVDGAWCYPTDVIAAPRGRRRPWGHGIGSRLCAPRSWARVASALTGKSTEGLRIATP